MKVKKPTKFLALFDIHCGWERRRTHGKESIYATHAEPAIRSVLKFAKDYRPDALILGGDQLNCGPISHWHKGKPRLDAGFSLRKEMDALNRLVLDPLDKIIPPGGLKFWFEGNHEVWIQGFIDENPGTEGLLEPRNYLRLEKRGYQIFEQGETSSLGKLHFVHGDVVLRHASLANPAKTLVMAYRKNIRAGHMHTFSAAVETTPVDSSDYHTGIVVPALSTKNHAYAKNAPNNCVNGFLCGTVYPDGTFYDRVVIINKGLFEYEGQIYNGNI